MARGEEEAEIEVSFRHVQGPTVERARTYAQKRLGRVVGSLPSLRSARAEISLEQARPSEDRYLVQLTLTADRAVLRAEDHGADSLSAIDRVHDLIARRIRDWKRRVYYRRRHQETARKETLAKEAAMLPAEEKDGLIVRVKSHETKPMFPEDAVEQMELLGHDFFFYLNGETGQHNVIYRRKATDSSSPPCPPTTRLRQGAKASS